MRVAVWQSSISVQNTSLNDQLKNMALSGNSITASAGTVAMNALEQR